MEFIDLRRQQSLIRGELEQRIRDVLDHGRYVLGPEIDELEQRLAEYVGVNHCVSASSGTDTLLVALLALEVGPGDEVITIPYTWISTAEVIALAGATPVFVDIQQADYNMDPGQLEAAITSKTKAIIPVGLYGQPADMRSINEIAERHGIPVIEDGAQSFGATHHGEKSCSLSTIGSTSFFPSKPLGCYGDGGALFTNDDDLARKMKQIRVHGQSQRNHHPILGINGRLDTLQATILLAKLGLFDDEILRRNEVAARYSQNLSEVSESIVVPMIAAGNTSVWAQYTLLCPSPETLTTHLSKREIPSVRYYSVPLHLQPVFAHLNYRRGDFPVAEKVSSLGLSLPMSPYLTDDEIDQVCEAVFASFN